MQISAIVFKLSCRQTHTHTSIKHMHVYDNCMRV